MKIQKISFVILFLLFYSCQHNPSIKENRDVDLQSIFAGCQLEHFPKDMESYIFFKSYLHPYINNKDNKGAYLKKDYLLPAAYITDLEKNLKYNAKYVVRHGDSCVLIIDRRELAEKEICDRKCKSLIPVPSFVEEIFQYKNEALGLLPNDFTLYILEIKKGMILSEGFYSTKNNMPEEWIHGLSRGIAISSTRGHVIFWIDTW